MKHAVHSGINCCLKVYSWSMRICFYTGYVSPFDHAAGKLASDIYGSELALVNLAAELAARRHQVCITSMNHWPDADFDGLQYVHHGRVRTMTFDVVIVWKQLNYFLYFADLAPQTFFWAHEVTPGCWMEGVLLQAAPLLANVRDRVTGYVALTEFHKRKMVDKYGLDESKVLVIGNAIQPLPAPPVEQRVRNRFIWVSAYGRGLRQLVEFFPTIVRHLPDAELHVFRQADEGYEDLLAVPHVKIHGFVSNEVVQQQMRQAEYWLYPTDVEETYCISALEAQRAGVLCIATALGALTETIGDRGVLLRQPVHTPEYWKEALDAILSLHADEGRKAELRERGMAWANQQTLQARALEWEAAMGAAPDDLRRHVRHLHHSLAIPQDHVAYLRRLAAGGFTPRVIYDIGACVCHWAREAKAIWPDARIILFDAWDKAEFLYTEGGYEYHLGVLTDSDGREVTFHQSDESPGGNSYYREVGTNEAGSRLSAALFPPDGGVTKTGLTLDTVVQRRGFPPPDLVKLDVQGCEQDILAGAARTLASARHLIAELQHVQYNLGAPMATETMGFLGAAGWTCTAPLFCNNGPDGDYGFEPSRPRVCLVMIVKDEAHVIEDALRCLLPHIDAWVVCDTGSTDGTQEVVTRFFEKHCVAGKLVQHAWRDFGHNRSLALEEAWTARGSHGCDYMLMFDADDCIRGELDLRGALETRHDSYVLKLRSGDTAYTRQCLFRCAKHLRWGYRGVLHEFPCCLWGGKKRRIFQD